MPDSTQAPAEYGDVAVVMITRNEEGAIAKVVDDAFAALRGARSLSSTARRRHGDHCRRTWRPSDPRARRWRRARVALRVARVLTADRRIG